MRIVTENESIVVDERDLRVVDRDGFVRLYHLRRDRDDQLTGERIVIAERHGGVWADTCGGRLDSGTAAIIKRLPIEERVRVRDGTKPMPPGTYWDFDLGHYVEPDDEGWSQARREAMMSEKRRRRAERSR